MDAGEGATFAGGDSGGDDFSDIGQTDQVSAILLNWKRPYHIGPIVESLAAHEFIAEVVIWDNARDDSLIDQIPETRLELTIIQSPEGNVCTFGRYLAAQNALHDLLYFQDDDCLVRNIGELWERWNAGGREKITAGLTEGHYRLEANARPFLQLGWGSLHRREWLDNAFEKWFGEYGESEDAVLHRKWDRIYSTLFGQHDPIIADVEHLKSPRDGRDSDRDANSLWLMNDHVAMTRKAIQLALKIKGAGR